MIYSMNYQCACCNYTTLVKANFQKHNISQKHLLKKANDIKTGVYTKSINETVVKERKLSHPLADPTSDSCTKNKDLKELVRIIHLQLQSEKEEREEREKERKEIQKQLQSQREQIENLIGKLEIHNSFNNNTINNYTLLVSHETDIANLTQEDYQSFYKKVSHFIHPDKESSTPENMNIYISNMKDRFMMVYSGNKWTLENKTQEIDMLTCI